MVKNGPVRRVEGWRGLERGSRCDDEEEDEEDEEQ